MDNPDYFRFVLAFIFVLGLIGAVLLIARRFGLGHRMTMNTSAQRRLGLVEIMSLDAKRRLVLLRRDDIEHLVILGPHGETLVERGITPPAAAFASHLSAQSDAEAKA